MADIAVTHQHRNRAFVAEGVRIMGRGLASWRIWHLLGTTELRQRYHRSRLGQMWLTLSTAVTIGTLGLVWSYLWRQPAASMIPWIGISLILWNYFSGIIAECARVFVTHGRYYLNQNMVLSVSIFSVIYKNTIVLLHNAVIIIVLMVIFGTPINLNTLALVPGLLLTWAAFLFLSYPLGMICTRFRDAGQIVDQVLQIFFFVTPVMWKPEFLPAEYGFLLDYNPFAIFLDLVRNPLLGQPTPPNEWLAALGITAIGAVAALWIIGRYERRVIYWV